MPSNPPTDKVVVDLDRPRYDQSTFWGRLRHFLDVTDLRTVFTTQTKLDESLQLLNDYKQKGTPPVSLEEAEKIWQAKKIRDAIVHPDTKENIILPFRLSMFVPMNIVICLGLLAPNPTIGSTIFWQWVNQSYNIMLNHANRNASNEMPLSQIAKSYGASILISCSVAVGLGQFVKRSTSFSPMIRTTIQKFVPYTAVASAGVANVFLMRFNEAQEGITVKDQYGKELGKSKNAGLNALQQVAVTRAVLPLPVLIFPPIIMSWLEQRKFMQGNPKLKTPAELVVISAMLWAGLPLAIALFPQQSELSVKKLEPQFHSLRDQNGKPIEKVYFNKGL